MSTEDYRGFRIQHMHAIVGLDENDEECIGAFHTPEGAMPMVATDRVRLDQLKKVAQMVSDKTGRSFKIVRFSVRETIGEIKSKRSN